MQCEFLVSNFKDPRTIALVNETIGHISDGSSPYCASVLKLWLKVAFELKKQRTQPGVQLRCPHNKCVWNTSAPYKSVRSTIYCPKCDAGGIKFYLLCVGCGCNRTGRYASCQNCGKRFI